MWPTMEDALCPKKSTTYPSTVPRFIYTGKRLSNTPHPADTLTGIQSPLVEARIRMAEMRIKLELRSELLGIGITPTDEQLDALLGAIPREDFYRLIAARA